MSKDDIYALLVNEAEGSKNRYTCYEMVCFCMGFLGKIDRTIYDCINKLYADSFIDQ